MLGLVFILLLFFFFGGSLNFMLVMGFLLCALLFMIGGKEMVSESLFFSLMEGKDYECGFESFSHKSSSFSIQFFIIGLSFMLFDLEICIFLPYIGSGLGGVFNVVIGLIFLIVVLLIFLYEMNLGALSW
uniref:NADH-ubiquinone oxidoreductase chain 3 n=1 Tax=Pyura gangelion TaxID=569434 RepID=S0DF58_PYUGA|nr:NADH dehydrogenase subunit 3 [Pyura gangelion]CCO25759.1 NADH dehydrogenase subunit 3 [Pyura gangelion]